jgi:murein DD-endopeptidase MepM/ murein hydrolase activator NlpD
LYQRENHDFGSPGGAGAGVIALAPMAATHAPSRRPRRRLSDIDLVVDLGARIGSAEWFRGLATLGAMIAVLGYCAPGMRSSPLRLASGPALAQHHEKRTLSRTIYRIPIGLPAQPRPSADTVQRRQPIAADLAPMRLTGSVGDGLYSAERAAGAPPDIVADYIKAIAPHIDFGDIWPTDRFDMVFEHERAATSAVRTGGLLYASLIHDGQSLRLMRWTLDGRPQWFDASGAGARRDGFVMPVSGARLSSGFGMRFHPILGFSRMHQGVDLAAPYGTPIVAAEDGVVRSAGWHGGHGNFVQIAHAGGMGTGYGHMSAYVVRSGESVQAGQLIGYVGSTGLSTGPHCHFEVYQGGVPVDPARATFATTTRLAGRALKDYKATMARLTALPFAEAVGSLSGSPGMRSSLQGERSDPER